MATCFVLLAVGLCVALLSPAAVSSSPAADGNHKMAPAASSSEETPSMDIQQLMEQCNETFPISMSLLEELNNTGSFQDEKDDTPMCYLHCMFDKAELMDMNGTFTVAKVKSMYKMNTNSDSRKEQLDDMISMCILQREETDNCHRVYGFVKCLMTEDIIRFGTPITRGEKRGSVLRGS